MVTANDLEKKLDEYAKNYRETFNQYTKYEIELKTLLLIDATSRNDKEMAGRYYARYKNVRDIPYPQSLVLGLKGDDYDGNR